MCFILFVSAFSYSSDFKRFFFFSEAVWLFVFVSLLGANLLSGNPLLTTSVFFVLVFTGCEAVVMAAILLVSSESAAQDDYLKAESL